MPLYLLIKVLFLSFWTGALCLAYYRAPMAIEEASQNRSGLQQFM